uniref:Uncharacterized protein n=2 Tax=unclassified Candidatus Kentrum TaxID=2643149 RepID=A0A451B106_9GAMM|nr:MAG: hypothetical protein BECKLPF1236B_GA0070989_10795 [Candidatus Kentron sp. LPFa]VFK66321.1 MAG: hypothetical protein BECKUNK1418G_GA0071005_108715 [Candidatus Kentron sp. UNK]VFK71954.1 MAG: hypothetical protein BECKUNK1418H_GA0071006_108815 [Candidatus Kentron sp. UNK]
MIDFTEIIGFDWDRGNRRKNADKHEVSESEAEQVFLDEPLLLNEDPGHSQTEQRFHALGVTTFGRKLHITFTLRGEGALIRIISARDMHKKERAYYDRETTIGSQLLH